MRNSSGIILAPLGAVYGGVMRARRALYRSGVLPTHRIVSPVISVGNMTTGGTGKTPLVDWVARAVEQEGRLVCVLSRGYKRADASKRVVVSDSKRILADVKEAGDEPFLLAEMLLGKASVISDADRVAAAHWAEENLGCDAFILDDGFQHLRLARDLDIVAIDATNPWGRGKLLPRGRLREPLKELARADCVIITRSEQVEDISSLRDEIRRWNDRCLFVSSRTRTSALRLIARPLDGPPDDPLAQSQIPPQPLLKSVAAFCAIGNPSAFFNQIRRDSHELVYSRSFVDHHDYRQSDITETLSQAKRAGAEIFMTTAKDEVKLRSLHVDLPCYVLEISLEFDLEEELRALIRKAVR